jgi:polyphenol oxidase
MPTTEDRKSVVESEIHVLDRLTKRAGLTRARKRASGRPAAAAGPAKVRNEELDALRSREPALRHAANGVQWLAAPGWKKLDWLWHGFSTRRGGVSRAYCDPEAQGELNLGFTAADTSDAVTANRRLLVEAIAGSPETPLWTIRQIHSNLVVRVGRGDAARTPPQKADGLMTDEPGVLLGVQTADCIPVLVADRRHRVVAAFHAGWRGTVSRIVENGIGRMRLEFGSRPEDLVAAIGPGIGLCCYSVGEEVLAQFESQFDNARELFLEVEDPDQVRARYPMLFLNQRAPGHAAQASRLQLDLVEANRRQLLAAGLSPKSIQVVGACTSCRPDLFFSHRASGGHAGRMMSVIGVRASR